MKTNLSKSAVIVVAAMLLSLPIAAIAQETGVPATDIVDVAEAVEAVESVESTGPGIGSKILEILMAIVGSGLFLAMIGHMIYVKVKLTPRYKTTFTVDDFKQSRLDAGLSLSSDTENQEMMECLGSIVETWKEKTNEETGEPCYVPTKFKHLKAAFERIDYVIAQCPTNEEVVEELNDYINIVTINEERHFDGSKVIMWISGIIAAILLFTGVWPATIAMLMSLAVYYLASMRPTFLLAKAKEGKVGIINKLLVGVFAMIGAAQTVRTTTIYDDGSKDVEDDHSQHWISLIIGLVIILIIAVYLPLWSTFNYLRNYIIYW